MQSQRSANYHPATPNSVSTASTIYSFIGPGWLHLISTWMFKAEVLVCKVRASKYEEIDSRHLVTLLLSESIAFLLSHAWRLMAVEVRWPSENAAPSIITWDYKVRNMARMASEYTVLTFCEHGGRSSVFGSKCHSRKLGLVHKRSSHKPGTPKVASR